MFERDEIYSALSIKKKILNFILFYLKKKKKSIQRERALEGNDDVDLYVDVGEGEVDGGGKLELFF